MLFLLLTMLVLGLLIGSFLNVLIYRLPRGESVILPPSHCPACGKRLRVRDLIPIFSYLWLQGRCRYCREPISWRYPLVESLTAVLTALWGARFSLTINGVAVLIFSYVLIVIAFIDLEHRIILNKLTLPMIILGLIFRWWQGELFPGMTGGLIGGGLLLVFVLLYPKGMGMGDVKFLTMAGIFLGWPKALFALFAGSFMGVLTIVPLILLKKIDRKTPFPFGPFLVTGTLIALYWEELVSLFLPVY